DVHIEVGQDERTAAHGDAAGEIIAAGFGQGERAGTNFDQRGGSADLACAGVGESVSAAVVGRHEQAGLQGTGQVHGRVLGTGIVESDEVAVKENVREVGDGVRPIR